MAAKTLECFFNNCLLRGSPSVWYHRPMSACLFLPGSSNVLGVAIGGRSSAFDLSRLPWMVALIHLKDAYSVLEGSLLSIIHWC